ncbi:SIMPL domain-containing protein [Psychrobacter sp. AOP22-C1-22]|uniref:SIMPL domain-containing protein n=1 Tax=unclassified Psychrobacter TaxID=196806 RepID=UPI0017886568|nr:MULTISPECIES: SIMPL domain-containing protein [unclassified Psychrobacter]MBE0405336.1 SIMPL domain-containing protein [Psychrobacter sp. FME6]MBE0445534.1 SIMPL domain-containing protein [Psychrobacter sp. FME5]MDN5891666.1 SIMPL domain-containing protein [Psychrobacter sp.]
MKTTLLNKAALATGTAALMTAMMGSAHAEPTGYDQLTFQTEVKEEVANDEVRASMYKKAQAADSKTLATTLNTSINNAMKIAKRYPSVTVTTGQQRTYPRYDKNDKIIGWTGQASIDLKSTDFAATSQLIADLQETLVMNNLNFGVSDAKKDALEQKLMTDASRAFQQQAKNMTRAWNARGYRVVNVNLNTGSNYPRPMYSAMNMKAASADASVPSQSFESGNSTISVTANGTIELTK